MSIVIESVGAQDAAIGPPVLEVPRAPVAAVLWYRALLCAAVIVAYYLINRSTYIFMDYWLLGSLGLDSVFWTNIRMAIPLYIVGFSGICAGIALPAFSPGIEPNVRRIFVTLGVLAGLLLGLFLSSRYVEFLAFFGGEPFGKTDPVFGNDLGFYVFSLPAIWKLWNAVFMGTLAGFISAIVCASIAHRATKREPEPIGNSGGLGAIATRPVLFGLGFLGVLFAAALLLIRYDLLWKDNIDAHIRGGAEYVDVVGVFSYLNYYYISALVILAITALLVFLLRRMRQNMEARQSIRGWPVTRKVLVAIVALVAFDFVFRAAIMVREVTEVSPNQPLIQLPYIKRHIDATLEAYGIDKIETVRFVPNALDDPLPDPDELLKTATLRNVPLWPGWVNFIDRLPSVQHSTRVLLTGGDTMIYGPLLDIYRQQQTLRTYYDVMDVDQVRYKINGEKKQFVSGVRELPTGHIATHRTRGATGTRRWVGIWGQRFLLFTHGLGLVMSPVSEIGAQGEPVYVSSGIPTKSPVPALEAKVQRIYYGEGSKTMGFSNAEQLKELDYATDEGRAEFVLPQDVKVGIKLDSLFRRFIVAWRSGVFFDILFSDLIGPETRLHFYRTPTERINRIAPFLYLDDDPYAIVADGRIQWMINGLATSRWYPYSVHRRLGHKGDERTGRLRRDRLINYARDAVKVVIDAYTGQVRLYKIADEPIVNTWARIYPELFTPADEMPQNIRDHIMYPKQLFQVQFDAIYPEYHMTDAMTFYNLEDIWTNAKDVLGPIVSQGASITFNSRPLHWMTETGKGPLPASTEEIQFTLTSAYTNQGVMNLRAIPMVYQDGDDYGRIMVLRVPKGHFYPGPEQAEAAIDQDPKISEQISWWNRMGAEVVRGHIAPLIIGDELIYVSPLFLRSRQNRLSQIKRVIVVFRGHAAEGLTLEEALTKAIGKVRKTLEGGGKMLVARVSEVDVGEEAANELVDGERQFQAEQQ